jgi:tRNA pseudouridine55 synthase
MLCQQNLALLKNLAMGRRRNPGRTVNGILLLDKPMGMTSNEALQRVKRLYQARKAGHTGSLDPLATGLLPVCLGEATKVSAFLLDADKRYQVRVRLGITTSTADAEGEVIATASLEGVDKAGICALLPRFRGEIEQLPPMYSAVKHKGERLYNLARQGIEVEREPRRITIHRLELIDWAPPELSLELHCSKGTYVRTLAEDLGRAAGCGAHVSALRRHEVGPYGAGMLTLDSLEAQAQQGMDALDALLLPMQSALAHWPELRVSDDSAYYLKQGQAVLIPQAPSRGWVRLYTKAGRFLGAGTILDDGKVQPKRLLTMN